MNERKSFKSCFLNISMAINKFERDVRKKYIGGPEIVDFFEQKSDYREVARDAARLGLERVYFVASHEGDVPEFVRTLENPRGYSKKCLYWSLQTARKETVYPLLEE